MRKRLMAAGISVVGLALAVGIVYAQTPTTSPTMTPYPSPTGTTTPSGAPATGGGGMAHYGR